MIKCLVVEDDCVCRKLLLTYLKDIAECDMAINGEEAVEAYEISLDKKRQYDLICLDVMMPVINGQDALRKIRKLEDNYGISGLDKVKVIMTTALDDNVNIMGAFKSGCEGYLIKPITKEKLFEQLRQLGFDTAECKELQTKV